MANPKPAPKPEALKSQSEAQQVPQIASNMMSELKVTGHLMALPAGLFCIFNEGIVGAVQQAGLPGVRISLPPAGNPNVEISGFRPDGWLTNGDATLVRISRGPAQILVTIYQLPNQAEVTPKLQVRQLTVAEPASAAPVPAPVLAKVDVVAHIQTRGDVGANFGDWLGHRGSQNWIEGFALSVPDGINPGDLSYQAVLGRGWLSPWFDAGQYCGSRGVALPLLGFRMRLQGAAAEEYEISCSAAFIDGTSCGPVGSDETCESASLAPLEALLINLTPKARKSGKAKR
jgi:hypothetical protein